MKLTRKFSSPALAIAVGGVFMLAGCVTNGRASSKGLPEAPDYKVVTVQRGQASWYSIRTNRGTHTASGERLCDKSATAAHKTLPMGTKVKVTNQANGKSAIVTINNRGPYIRGRIIDVTVGTAERLGFRQRGVAPVKVEVLERVNGSVS